MTRREESTGVQLLQLLLLLLGVLLQPVHAKQYFKQQPKYTEVNPGGSVVLDCLVAEKTRNSECIWQHDGLPILIQSGKYEWSGNRENGDCSLRILRSSILYDDGAWSCQVTRSSYEAGDGLSSNVSQLVVRQPPTEPRLFKQGEYIASGELSVEAGSLETLECESRGGNPAPRLVWYLEDEEVESVQRNETEAGTTRRWTVVSSLQISLGKEDNGKRLRCVVEHEALTRKMREIRVNLDVQYPPSVRLERTPTSEEVEDGEDSVVLSCLADGNPVPDIVWRKLGQSSIFRIQADLRFEPVQSADTGTYICLARNSLGASDEISAVVDVRYPPRRVETEPANFVDVEVGSQQELNCRADGNPEPEFEWVQKVEADDGGRSSSSSASAMFHRGSGKQLVINNVTYEHEGLWQCSAKNVIKGEQRRIYSPLLRVGVSGRPLIRTGRHVELRSLHEAQLMQRTDLEVEFCSDPPPRSVRWEWGSVQLEQGRRRGRISAGDLTPTRRKDCYASRLSFDPVNAEDERTYYLVAENERGQLRSGVKLAVTDPVSMVTVIGVAVSLLVLISAVLVCTVCTRKYRKCCFQDKGHFEPQDIRIERRSQDEDRGQEPDVIADQGCPPSATNGLGREVTYKGHAGLGRPVPAPFCSSRPPAGHSPTPYTIANLAAATAAAAAAREEQLIQPKKVRGTPTMYADLQFPSSSNGGSMKRRGVATATAAERETEYVRIKYKPHRSERADV